VRIFVSGGLDEHNLARFVAAGTPIDAAGVGTRLGVSADAPTSTPPTSSCLRRALGRQALREKGDPPWTEADLPRWGTPRPDRPPGRGGAHGDDRTPRGGDAQRRMRAKRTLPNRQR
jgi:hypothetical protein